VLGRGIQAAPCLFFPRSRERSLTRFLCTAECRGELFVAVIVAVMCSISSRSVRDTLRILAQRFLRLPYLYSACLGTDAERLRMQQKDSTVQTKGQWLEREALGRTAGSQCRIFMKLLEKKKEIRLAKMWKRMPMTLFCVSFSTWPCHLCLTCPILFADQISRSNHRLLHCTRKRNKILTRRV
jgi:hypothetical protein